jgi:zinc transporter ZupT
LLERAGDDGFAASQDPGNDLGGDQELSIAPRVSGSAKPRLWLPPLAAGVFAGVAAFEVVPAAIHHAGQVPVLVWGLVGLAFFVVAHRLLGRLGHHGSSWAGVMAMWMHSYMEGLVAAAGYAVSPAFGVVLSLGLVGHLAPEVSALVAVLVDAGLSVRQALARASGTAVAVALGILAGRLLIPGVAPEMLGRALAFGCGGLAFLAYGSWRQRRGNITVSWTAALLGAGFMGLPLLLGRPF